MRFITGFLFGTFLLGVFLLATALLLNAPLLVAARLTRKRLRPLVPKLTLAIGFAVAAAYALWKMEWFDVWRHGVPPVRYVLRAYLPWIVTLGFAGWFLGGLVVGPRRAVRGFPRRAA